MSINNPLPSLTENEKRLMWAVFRVGIVVGAFIIVAITIIRAA